MGVQNQSTFPGKEILYEKCLALRCVYTCVSPKKISPGIEFSSLQIKYHQECGPGVSDTVCMR